MRIGIDARMYSTNFTGIGRYVYELTERLFKIDQKNEYILFLNDPEYEKFTPPNARVRKVRVNAKHYSWREQWSFYRLLQKAHLDVMHFTHFNAPLLYRRPSVVTIHDLTLSFYPGKKMTHWFYRMAYHLVFGSVVRKTRAIIAVSQNTAKDLASLYPKSASKTHVIYEGVGAEFLKHYDIGKLASVRQKIGVKEPYLLYTGVWRSHKNLVGLIRAFGMLHKKKFFKGQLVITGREDPFYPEVKKTIRAEGLEKNVLCTGLVNEETLIALYRGANIYVMPSFYEGFGLPVLEAFASECPVAAARASSLPEVCGPDGARFFNPHDPADIAHSIREILEKPELRAKLIAAGKKRLSVFSWDRMAEETLKIYNVKLAY